MAQLSSHDKRTGRPVQPGAQRHRPDPLRHPSRCCPLLPLAGTECAEPTGDETTFAKAPDRVPFSIPPPANA
nr:hypothetical protein [Pseudorhizobium flavum]